MNTKASWVLSAALTFTGAVGVSAALLAPSVAEAQQKVSAKVGVPLKAAQEAVQKKNWNGALAKIKEAQAVTPRTPYDDYMINELLWYVYLQQGRNADAARLLEQQIASGQMPANQKVSRTKTLAQLYFRSGNYGKAIQTANQYLKSAPGDQEMQLMVAQGYFQQKDYKNAVAMAERMAKGQAKPSEDLLQLMQRSYYELKDADGTARTLELLLKYYPSPDTWDRLLGGIIEQTKHDHELIALYRLSEDVGALRRPNQYIDMTQALVVGGFAIEGQRVLEKGIASGAFTAEDQTRAQRTLDTAKRRADEQRKATRRSRRPRRATPRTRWASSISAPATTPRRRPRCRRPSRCPASPTWTTRTRNSAWRSLARARRPRRRRRSMRSRIPSTSRSASSGSCACVDPQ